MKSWRRFLAFLLALAMILGTMPLSELSTVARAEGTTRKGPLVLDGKGYVIYSCFIGTDSSDPADASRPCSYAFDGNLSSIWDSDTPDGTHYVEFYSDLPILLEGIHLYYNPNAGGFPTDFKLFARENPEDEWTTVADYADCEKPINKRRYAYYACDNEEGKEYQYFRFEAVGSPLRLAEIRLYGDGFVSEDLGSLGPDRLVYTNTIFSGETSNTLKLADGVTVRLKDATINGGIRCEGNATIILEGLNVVRSVEYRAGIRVGGPGTTLTIGGDGCLDVRGGYYGAGIGLDAAWGENAQGGDVVIEGGDILILGGCYGAGIGTGAAKNNSASMGNITIKGGKVQADASEDYPSGILAYGIGRGYDYGDGTFEVGKISIHDGIDWMETSPVEDLDGIAFLHDGEDGASDVSQNRSDYFGILKEGNKVTIASKDDVEHAIHYEDVPEGCAISGPEKAKGGELVSFTVTAEKAYELKKIELTDGVGNITCVSTDGFIMPRSDVTVKGTFIMEKVRFNEKTGVLTFAGDLEWGDFEFDNQEAVKVINCKKGATLPGDCVNIFGSYPNVTCIDLSNADASGVSDITFMFKACPKLETIYVNTSWKKTDGVNVFSNDHNIVGGHGTTYDPDTDTEYEPGIYYDGKYATIDRPDHPGYFTGVYSLILPEGLEIARDAAPEFKHNDGYLIGATIALRALGEQPISSVVDGEEVIEADEEGLYVLTVTDHDLHLGVTTLKYEALSKKEATCTEGGIALDCCLREDGRYFTDETGKTELSESEVIIPALNHDAVHVEENEEHLQYWYCQRCHKYFSDASLEKEIEKEDAYFVTIDLGENSGDLTVTKNTVLTGKTSSAVTIADGVTVRLKDATIYGGIICEGTATILLKGENSVTAPRDHAGISVGGPQTTLIIGGEGSLEVTGGYGSAGIGLGRAWTYECLGGDIIIEGGNVTAVGGSLAAGIGTGTAKTHASIGNITIKGGTVNARKGDKGEAIGKGNVYPGVSCEVGKISVHDSVRMVDAGSITDYGNVVFLHDGEDGATDVSQSKTDYFGILKEGDRVIIVPKDDVDHAIYYEDATVGGVISGPETAKGGEMVSITFTAEDEYGYDLQGFEITDEAGHVTYVSGKILPMPKSDVTVKGIFDIVKVKFDEGTGTLTLAGEIAAEEISGFESKYRVKTICCRKGTILPMQMMNACSMYNNCTCIDLSNADASRVNYIGYMFAGCSSLQTIYVNSSWPDSAYGAFVFRGDGNLVGGSGTKWDDQHLGDEYATIDRPNHHGYFTGVYSLILPEGLEIARDAAPKFKHNDGYLIGATIALRALGGQPISSVVDGEEVIVANGEGLYVLKVTDHDLFLGVTYQEAKEPARAISIATAFKGKFQMNFYLYLPESLTSDEGAYAMFTGGSADKKIMLSSLNGTETEEGVKYKLSYDVYAKEVRDVINLRLYYGNGEKAAIVSAAGTKDYTETGIETSLLTYLDYCSTSSDAKLVALAEAAKNYCTAVQINFGYKAEGLSFAEELDDVTEETLKDYAAKITGTMPAGVSVDSISAIFEADNSFRLYLKFDGSVAPGKYKYYVNDKAVKLKSANGKYYLEVKNVGSNHLDDDIKFTITRGKKSCDVTVSVLTYARSCVLYGTGNLPKLAKALYLYNQAAVEKFGK